MTKRIIQYIAGLILMALAVVLSKRSELGLSPISTAPAALTAVTGISLGVTTIFFHLICLGVIIIVLKKFTLKSGLTLAVALGFGVMIDLFMTLIGPVPGGIIVRIAVVLLSIVTSAFGIVMIVGADLMLPSPDAMLRCISLVYKKPYSAVKNAGDIFWVVLAVIIELAFTGRLTSVGLGTILTALLAGRFVKLFTRCFPMFSLVREPKF